MKINKSQIQYISLFILAILFYCIYPLATKMLISDISQANNNTKVGININEQDHSNKKKYFLLEAKIPARGSNEILKRSFLSRFKLPGRKTNKNTTPSFESNYDLYGNFGDTETPIIEFKYTIQSSTLFNGPLLKNPDNPFTTISGLDFSSYQGRYKTIPDLSTLTPSKTSKVSTFNMSPISRLENSLYKYSGFINITTDGIYTFYINSDDGSKLYIGHQIIINNDGKNIEREVSGTIGLKAGKHAITVTCLENNKKQAIEVSYSSPFLAKQGIPASALFSIPADALRDPENPYNTVIGLNYLYFEGHKNNDNDFNTLTAAKTGTVYNFDISPKLSKEQFAFNFKGFINIPSDGLYSFYINSSNGSKLYIGNQLVVAEDSLNLSSERFGTIGLKMGKHAISVSLYNHIGNHDLRVSYSGPAIIKQVIPNSALFRVNGSNTKSISPTEFIEDNNVVLQPMPVVDLLNIKLPENPGNAEIVVTDLSSKAIVLKKEVNFTDNSTKLDLKRLNNGWYILSIRNGLKQYDKRIQIKK